MRRKIISITIILCTLICLLGGCQKKEKSVSKSGFYFDTIISITLFGTEDSTLIDNCFTLAAKCEALFSNHIDDSEISQINAQAGKNYVKVSEETLSLINKGIEYSKNSEGVFDITIGPLSDLWNIPEISKNLQTDDNQADSSCVPNEDSIKKILPHIDYSSIKIKNDSIMLKDSESKLDVGGIAKGYIADLMKDYLVSQGVTSGIINLGGNVLTIGHKLDGSEFNVGIQKPFEESGVSISVIPVADKSIVTSGVYERYFKYNEKLYHHILDTQTGYPYNNGLLSVTIISDKSIDGDALSTTCFALGKEKGMALIESLENIEAVFIYSDYSIHPSSGIKDKF